MQNVLRDLAGIEGMLGCLIMTSDGILADHCFGTSRDPERISALVSSCLLSLDRAAGELGMGALNSMMWEAERTMLFVRPCPGGMLIGLTDRRAQPGLIRVEMEMAVERLQRMRAEG